MEKPMEVHQLTEMGGNWLEKSHKILYYTLTKTPLFAGETVETKTRTIITSSEVALLLKTIGGGYTRPYKTVLNVKYPLRVKPYILDIYLKTGQKEINCTAGSWLKKISHQEMVITGEPNFKCMDANYNGHL